MVRAVSFPLGVRFVPTDEELLLGYLKTRIEGEDLPFEAIRELNLYDYEPSDLPGMSCLDSKDRMWYFFCHLEKKYKKGKRISRVTRLGFWKITGNSTPVMSHSRLVGERKDLVFHNGKPPGNQESRTNWVMHEFSLNDKELGGSCNHENLVVCKIFEKSGKGPQNGAQYGAPFEETASEISDEIVPSLFGNTHKSVTYNGSFVTQSPQHDLREKSQEFRTSFISHHSSPSHEPHKRSRCEHGKKVDTSTPCSSGTNEKFVPYNGSIVTQSPHLDLREKSQEFGTSFISHCSSPRHEPHKRSHCEYEKKVDTSTSYISGTNKKGFLDDDDEITMILSSFLHNSPVNMFPIFANSHGEGHSHLENENQYCEGLFADEISRTPVVPPDPHSASIDLPMENYFEVDDMKSPMVNIPSTEICNRTHGLHVASVLSSIEANSRQGDIASPIAKVGDQDGCCL